MVTGLSKINKVNLVLGHLNLIIGFIPIYGLAVVMMALSQANLPDENKNKAIIVALTG